MEQITKKNFQSNLSNIINVTKLLGIELNKPFRIQFFNHKEPYDLLWYKVTENGLMYGYNKNGYYYHKSDALEGLLIGKHQIVKV